jgi:hypothetical protein
MNVDSSPDSIIICHEPAKLPTAGCAGWQLPEPCGDEDYFRAREQAERAAAKAAVSKAARAIHQELAQIYGRLARQPNPTK